MPELDPPLRVVPTPPAGGWACLQEPETPSGWHSREMLLARGLRGSYVSVEEVSPAMNRRGFLRALTGAAVGIVASEELLELLAPRKTIVLPPLGGWLKYRQPGFTTLAELQAITSRAFIPQLVVQIYRSSPLLQALIDNATPAREPRYPTESLAVFVPTLL